MAQQQVLSTYELLETILHALPTRDLLLSQRVSRAWHDVVERSHKLQRALFIMPAGREDGTPLMLIRHAEAFGSRKWAYEKSGVGMEVYRNPLLEPLHKASAIEIRLPWSWQRPEASW